MIRDITIVMLHALNPDMEPERVEEMVQVTSQVAHNRHEVALIITRAGNYNRLLTLRHPFWRMEPLPLARETIEDVTVDAFRECGTTASLSVRLGWHMYNRCASSSLTTRLTHVVEWLESIRPTRTIA